MKNLICFTFLFLAFISMGFAQDFKAGDRVRLGMNEGVISIIKDGKAYLELDRQVEKSGKTKEITPVKLRLETYKLQRDAISLVPLKTEVKGDLKLSDKVRIEDRAVSYRRGNAQIGKVVFEGSVIELFENGYAKIEYSEYTEIPSNMKGAYKQSLPESNIKLLKLSDISLKNITPLSGDAEVDYFKAGDDVMCTDKNGVEFGGKIEELYKSKEAKVKFTYRYVGNVEKAISESIATISLEDCGSAARDARIASSDKKEVVETSEEARSVSSERREAQKKDKRIEYYMEDGELKVKVISK